MFIAFDKIVQPSFFFNSGSTNNNQTDDRDGNFQIKNKLANRSPHYPRPNIDRKPSNYLKPNLCI